MKYETFKKMKYSEDPELKKEYEALQDDYNRKKASIVKELSPEKRIARQEFSLEWPNDIRIHVSSNEMFQALKMFLYNQKAEFRRAPSNIFENPEELGKALSKSIPCYYISYNGDYYQIILSDDNDNFRMMLFGNHAFPLNCSRIIFEIVDNGLRDGDIGSLIYPQYVRPITLDNRLEDNSPCKIAAIVAASPSGIIGQDGDLLYHNPDDLRFVRNMTMGLPIVMGYNTFKSLKGRKLNGRMIIVMARQTPETIEMVNSGEMIGNEALMFTALRNGTSFSNRPYLYHYDTRQVGRDKKARITMLTNFAREHMKFERLFVFGGADLYDRFSHYIDEWYVTEYDDEPKNVKENAVKICKYWEFLDDGINVMPHYYSRIKCITERIIRDGVYGLQTYTTSRYTIHRKKP